MDYFNVRWPQTISQKTSQEMALLDLQWKGRTQEALKVEARTGVSVGMEGARGQDADDLMLRTESLRWGGFQKSETNVCNTKTACGLPWCFFVPKINVSFNDFLLCFRVSLRIFIERQQLGILLFIGPYLAWRSLPVFESNQHFQIAFL